MKKCVCLKCFAATVLAGVFAATSLAGAATMGRVIPSGTVTLHKNDQIIAKYSDQAPIDDTALMTCEQPCSVKMSNMSLIVEDDSTFAVRDNEGVMNLYVKNGLVQFTVANTTQQVSFYTPDGRYVKSEGFIPPSSPDQNVSGFMRVVEGKAQIGIQQGGMILATADGIQTIDSGYAYTVDLNDLPATGVGAEIGEGGAPVTGGMIAVGSIAAGTVAAIIFNDSDSVRAASQNQ